RSHRTTFERVQIIRLRYASPETHRGTCSCTTTWTVDRCFYTRRAACLLFVYTSYVIN
ncbi:unnamed protein product, partial [Ascophyllum nodosum]